MRLRARAQDPCSIIRGSGGWVDGSVDQLLYGVVIAKVKNAGLRCAPFGGGLKKAKRGSIVSIHANYFATMLA